VIALCGSLSFGYVTTGETSGRASILLPAGCTARKNIPLPTRRSRWLLADSRLTIRGGRDAGSNIATDARTKRMGPPPRSLARHAHMTYSQSLQVEYRNESTESKSRGTRCAPDLELPSILKLTDIQAPYQNPTLSKSPSRSSIASLPRAHFYQVLSTTSYAYSGRAASFASVFWSLDPFPRASSNLIGGDWN